MNIKKLFLSRQFKITVDILMFLSLSIAFTSTKSDGIENIHWNSIHCISAIILTLLMLVHIVQNWRFTKSVFNKKVMKRNKITALMTYFFIPVFITILLFVFGVFSIMNLGLHHLTGGLFAMFVIIHIIQKFKRFISLFKKKTKFYKIQE